MRTHTQCRLAKGTTQTVSWIPSEKAVVGKRLKLRDDNGVWTNGWGVLEVGTTLASKEVIEREKINRKTPPSLVGRKTM